MKEEKGQIQPQLYGTTYLLVSFTLTGQLEQWWADAAL
jgi:hypothetical protein